MIPFNKPYLTGKEIEYIQQAVVQNRKTSGNGLFTKKCHDYFKNYLGCTKALLTTSCTDALEMASILIDVQPGDEIIVPSYTFVSTANAFINRGAKIVFADSQKDHPNLDVDLLPSLITEKTKAIVCVHYAGFACDMDKLQSIVSEHNLFLIEDAAQAIDSYWKGRPLGSFGHLSTFSFHETKNIISGEGGILIVNEKNFADRAEIIWEKGTNRAQFARGEVSKYNWIDAGSSFLPSEIIAAFLYAQLESLEIIQEKRKLLWNKYYELLSPLKDKIGLPIVPEGSTVNGHIFYIMVADQNERDELLDFLKKEEVLGVFHYLCLHKSPMAKQAGIDGGIFTNSEKFESNLIRLPLYYEMTTDELSYVVDKIHSFYEN